MGRLSRLLKRIIFSLLLTVLALGILVNPTTKVEASMNSPYYLWSVPDSSQMWSYIVGVDGTIYFTTPEPENRMYLNFRVIDRNGVQKINYKTGGYSYFKVAKDGTIFLEVHDPSPGMNATKIIALDPNGNEKWQIEPDAGYVAGIGTGENGTYYFASFENDENFFITTSTISAINSTGSAKWSYKLDGQVRSANEFNGDVYVTYMYETNGQSFCGIKVIDMYGKLQWTYEQPGTGEFNLHINETDGTIYAWPNYISGNTKNILHALNPDGTVKWVYQMKNSYSTAVSVKFNGESIYLIHSNGSYHDIADNFLIKISARGDKKWEYKVNGKYFSIKDVGSDGTAFISNYNGVHNLYAVSSNGSTKWVKNNFHVDTLKASKNGTIYAYFPYNPTRSIYAINPDGTIKANYDIGTGPMPFYVGEDGVFYLNNFDESKLAVRIDDTTAPTTTSTLNPDMPNGMNGWYTNDLAIKLDANDDVSGIEKTEYRINGSDWTPYTEELNVTTEGLNTIEYRSIDNEGNIETINSKVVKIDKTAPITSVTPINDGWYNSDVKLNLSTNDELSGLEISQYKVNDGDWQEYKGSIVLTDEGMNNLQFRSIDKAGNVEDTKSVEVKIDKTAPILNVSFDQSIILTKNHKLVPITAFVKTVDNLSGVATYELASIVINQPDNGKGDGNTVQDIQGAVYDTPDIDFLVRAERSGSEDRVYTVTYKGTDNAGNSVTTTHDIIVKYNNSKK
jgi:hypothetical protein